MQTVAVDILFVAFRLLENFFIPFVLIGEEEDFLDFLFLLEREALSNSRSIVDLQMHLVGLDPDHIWCVQLALRWATGEIVGK